MKAGELCNRDVVTATRDKVTVLTNTGVQDTPCGWSVGAPSDFIEFSLPGRKRAKELIAYCRDHLAALKCPRSVDFERALPRSEAGKLFKRRLRDRYWQDRPTRIG